MVFPIYDELNDYKEWLIYWYESKFEAELEKDFYIPNLTRCMQINKFSVYIEKYKSSDLMEFFDNVLSSNLDSFVLIYIYDLMYSHKLIDFETCKIEINKNFEQFKEIYPAHMVNYTVNKYLK